MLIDKLKKQDEVTILELLEIYSDELVDRFMDKVEDKIDFLEKELGSTSEEDD